MADRQGSVIRFKFGYVVAAIIAVVLVGVIVNIATKQPVNETVSTPSVSQAAASSASIAPQDQEDTPSDTSDLSTIQQPTVNQVWQFETAHNTRDPQTKAKLLATVATSQYIEANRDDYSKASDITVAVNQSKSRLTVTVDTTRTSSYVETRVVLDVSESGVTKTVTLAPHGSYWINTIDGWKIARDAEVR